MKIFADIRQEVDVDPKKVIEKLIEKEVSNGWVFEENNKYYKGFVVGSGCHSFDDKIEITKEKYDYVNALELVFKHIK